jgi:rod shape-determining protein MreC
LEQTALAKAVENRHSRLLLAGLVVSHLVIVSHQVDAGGSRSLLERTAFLALAPLQRAVAAGIRGVEAAWSGYVGLRGVHEDNARLRERARALELELERSRSLAQEAERLRELLALKSALPYESVSAEVLSRDGNPWFRGITIDKGARAGVRLQAPVISSSGIVGRVVKLGPEAARVQLLLDRDAGIGVLIERTRVSGVLAGQVGFADKGTTDLLMRYVPALTDVAVGDRVLSSGLDRIYPKGLVVGRVRSVGPPSGLFREVVVTPSARFDQLEQVLVLKLPEPDLEMTESVR